MISLFRYTAAVLLHSQRFLPPLMCFVGIAIMFTANSTAGPVAGTYGAVAGALFVCSTWFTIVVVATEDPVHRTITTVNANGAFSVLIVTALVALTPCLVVSGALLTVPLLIGQHGVTSTDLAVGFLAQCTAASTGTALGILVSRLVIDRAGYSLFAALSLICVCALVDGLPPINPMIRMLVNSPGSSSLLPSTARYAGMAVVLLIISTTVTHQIAARRN